MLIRSGFLLRRGWCCATIEAIRGHSLEERYPSHAGYVNAVAAAADNLRRERLLPDGDVDAVLRKAQEAPVGR